MLNDATCFKVVYIVCGYTDLHAGKETEEVVKALPPEIMNAKYVNAVPLYRQEQEFERYGLHIPRQNMTNWTVQCADRYLAVLYDYLHEKLYGCHVLQADEMPVLVNKDGRPASHPREFLKDFSGVCVTDGYQVYHTIEGEREDLLVAGCWSHVRRRFDEAVKALPKQKQKDSRANLALTMIQAIYREEK